MTEHLPASDETITRLSELARQAMTAQANLAKASIELGRATLSAEVDPTTAGRAWVEAVSREGAAYWQEVGALGLDVAARLVTLGSHSAARVLRETRSAGRQTDGRGPAPGPVPHEGTSSGSHPQPSGSAHRASHHHHTTGFDPVVDTAGPSRRSTGVPSTAPRPASGEGHGSRDVWLDPAPDTVDIADGAGSSRRVEVTLRGVPGETARGTMTLSNQHPRARRVTLTPSDVRPGTGRDVSLGISVDPEAVTIGAMSEHDVQLAVDLLAAVVRPGERLTGTVEVSGGVEAVFDVVVEVVGVQD